ncbi:Down syndrome cell adhesion molecule-like protein Dscam2 [Portunus trituberculatus]|uniref:Down syndrome cell adhesion molecule-like protein Dscam2 n=1 Tax=Portunus trituberculatus TaxID=210409 RepID=A0A5B7GW22_PORTR|nr:Down syndrome cell adhesion molecule-like protein Dscam2 [Portunus trituberculatus]
MTVFGSTVPPSLAPLTFPKGTRAGMQIRATCLVQEGDQPVRYAWTKDARPLDARLGVRTSQLDAFTSILVIERAAAEHSGNYTCTASNAAAASATTARLTVNVPPTWVVEPSSTSVALGGSLALHCLARGFPDPVVTWRRQAGKSNIHKRLPLSLRQFSKASEKTSRVFKTVSLFDKLKILEIYHQNYINTLQLEPLESSDGERAERFRIQAFEYHKKNT